MLVVVVDMVFDGVGGSGDDDGGGRNGGFGSGGDGGSGGTGGGGRNGGGGVYLEEMGNVFPL